MTSKILIALFAVLSLTCIADAQKYRRIRNLREAVFGFPPGSASSESTDESPDVSSFFMPKREQLLDPFTGQRYPASRASIRRMFRFS
ncbi:unnamed protein product [Bursaphelenchus xylophilus]|uniref:(pine wood nematode) hypothetical protein n=1 Tax=Bursaphelenchus xylophilus TaxID=6326 RepID=A0A1I7RVC7_BURXY|nr:unnamed protein product [Bursaphelenchus xylophilus]CAG9086680.1 unnamed protein product [Bursaphelenchus xylophilus]